MSERHPQITIPEGTNILGVKYDSFECDEELVELLTLINKCGFETIMSCQGDEPKDGEEQLRRIWIEMFLEDLESFLEALSRQKEVNNLESLSARIATDYCYEGVKQYEYKLNRRWKYKYRISRSDEGDLTMYSIGIWIPYTDIKLIINRLQKYSIVGTNLIKRLGQRHIFNKLHERT